LKQVEELRYLILAAQREGSRIFAEILFPLGLTPSQSEVLRVLYDFEPLSLVQLGELLVCETGSPSRLIKRLCKAGLVELNTVKEDARKVRITLTQKGRDSAGKIIAVEEKFYKSFSPLLKGASVQELIEFLWKQVEGKPAGKALALRKHGKINKSE
jgi:DNA-binding MarR family transcriptional regulator